MRNGVRLRGFFYIILRSGQLEEGIPVCYTES